MAEGQRSTVTVPPTGHVIFLLTAPRSVDVDDELVAEWKRMADEAAPGRNTAVVLSNGVSLNLVTDEQLARIGLHRTPQP